MKKRVTATLLCSIFCIMFITACKTTDKAVQPHEQTLSESPNETVSPQQGGSISIYIPKPDTLCPIRTQNSQTASMLNLIFDSLIINSASMTAMPNLAASWTVNENGLEWTIKLRNDVSWHDNTQLVAADVVYTINQIRTDKDNFYSKNVAQISKVTASGQHEVNIQLKTPQSNFINLLTFPIIKSQRGAVDKDSFTVVGTGAFRFDDRGEITTYYLRKNNDWWKKPAYLDTIQVKILPDKDTALYSFSSGEIDLLCVDSADLGSKVDTTNAGFFSYPTNRFHFLGFNNINPALKNKEVRRAISLAVDRPKLINALLNDDARPASVPLASDWELYIDTAPPLEADITEAKRLLEESGWEFADGIYQKKIGNSTVKLEFELLVNDSNPTRVQIGGYLAGVLRNIGVSVTLKQVSFADYNNLINRKSYDMFLGAFRISEELDYRFMLEKGNLFAYQSSEMDTALNETQKAVTLDQRKENYARLQALLGEEVPFCGLYFENASMLYNKRMHGSFSPRENSIYNGIENIFVTN